jgi:hypothetical protein
MWSKRLLQFTLVALLSVLLVMTATAIYRERARYISAEHLFSFRLCLSDMLLLEETALERLPPASVMNENGVPIASWRQVRYIQQMPIPENPGPRDLSWMDPRYQRLRATPAELFCYSGNTFTSVMAVVGPGTAFGADERLLVSELPDDCILIVEVYQRKIHWMEPGDLDISALQQPRHAAIRPSNNWGNGFCVGFADGSVWRLRNDTPLDVLTLFCTVEGARKSDRESTLRPYRVQSVKPML